MTTDVIDQLAVIIRETFDEPDATVTPETTALDIPGWDSLSHTILMLTVEKHFGVQFAPGQTFENVGDLAETIRVARR